MTCGRWWFSPVSATNKSDHHDIHVTEILLNTIALALNPQLLGGGVMVIVLASM